MSSVETNVISNMYHCTFIYHPITCQQRVQNWFVSLITYMVILHGMKQLFAFF